MIRCIIFCLALAVLGRAQSTWVVDAALGTGAHFADLPAAVTAASNGDTIVIRPGAYSTFTATKGLRILGRTGVRFDGPGGSVKRPILIANLAVGQQFVLADIDVLAPEDGLGVAISNCRGTVHLERLDCSVTMTDSPRVSMNRCTFAHVGASNSSLALSNCTGVGAASWLHCFRRPVPVVLARRSVIHVTDSVIRGGSFHCRFGMGPGLWVAGHGLELTDCDLFATGTSAISAAGGSVTVPSHGILAHSMTRLYLDPSVAVSSQWFAAIVGGTVIRGMLPGLAADGAAPGSVVSFDMVAPAGTSASMLIGVPAALLPTPFGLIGIDPSAISLIANNVIPASGRWKGSIPVPTNPRLHGFPLALQGVSFLASGLMVTTPALAVLH